MLYFEAAPDGDEIFVHMDSEGIELLKRTLAFLEQQPNQPEHSHLMSEVWGGNDLVSKIGQDKRDKDLPERPAVDHVKLCYWP